MAVRVPPFLVVYGFFVQRDAGEIKLLFDLIFGWFWWL